MRNKNIGEGEDVMRDAAWEERVIAALRELRDDFAHGRYFAGLDAMTAELERRRAAGGAAQN